MREIVWTRLRVPAALFALVLAVGAVAGCGGDGDDEAEIEEISEVISTALTTDDEQVTCTETISESFVSDVYGDVETCLEAEAPDPDEELPDEAEVSEVEVDGDTATASVTEVGGETGGATGTVSLVREDGGWRISELGIDYLRSMLESGFENAEFTEEDAPLDDADFRDCLLGEFEQVDDETLREFAYQSMADKDPGQEFLDLFLACMRETGAEGPDVAGGDGGAGGEDGGSGGEEVSVIRQQFEEGIRESLQGDGISAAALDCVIGELRSSITDEDIVDQVRRGREDVNPELAAEVARAMAAC